MFSIHSDCKKWLFLALDWTNLAQSTFLTPTLVTYEHKLHALLFFSFVYMDPCDD